VRQNDALSTMLLVLLSHPEAASVMDEAWLDEIQDLFYFDMEIGVTAAGRDFLATYERSLAPHVSKLPVLGE
jgi:hypothetical protein